MILPIRVVIGRERMCLNYLEKEVSLRGLELKSILFLEELKGYLFLEGEREDINRAIYAAPHVRGIVRTPVEVKEISRYLTKEKPSIELNIMDTIEVLSGPFKGEKGRIMRINDAKKELTIELLEAVVSIPLTISINIVRLIEKSKKEEKE
ncbi:MAG: transcription elongation factor Spt5 [Candidatus Aenigmarchaeota archaeon]|nr:transcription elongation factor Spt5 [Candidatus Aenigmarchaeota archaeon]